MQNTLQVVNTLRMWVKCPRRQHLAKLDKALTEKFNIKIVRTLAKPVQKYHCKF